MPSKHTLVAAAVCALPLSIAACGSSNSGSSTITPEGTHYGYVVSNAFVPTNDPQVSMYGLDLGTKTTSTPDGVIDNALGKALSALTALKFDIQGTINTAVDQGNIILLVDFQTKDFMNASASGLTVKIGANPVPPACTDPTDMTCRHHLTGTGMFSISPDSPSDAELGGALVNGTFTGGPGNISLQIAIGSAAAPIKLDLVHARASATQITDAGLTAVLGGLVLQSDLTGQIGPAIAASVATIITRDCPGARTPPGCGCTAGTTGALVISTLDGDLTGTQKDCMVSTDEVLGYPVVKALLTPDSCSMDTCSAADSLSIGVKVQAVKGTFPM